jgi:hypothetical protein
MEAIPVKVPEWDRTQDKSVARIGPWTATCAKEVDEDDGTIFWEVDVEGPWAADYLQYFDSEYHGDRTDAEWDAVCKVSGIAGILEPLQRYL